MPNDDGREVTTRHKIEALRMGADAARANGSPERAASMDRSADLLENPDLPPTLEEQVEGMQSLMKQVYISQVMAVASLAQVMGASPSACRSAADRLEGESIPADAHDRETVVAGVEGGAYILRQVATHIETGKMAALTSGPRH